MVYLNAIFFEMTLFAVHYNDLYLSYEFWTMFYLFQFVIVNKIFEIFNSHKLKFTFSAKGVGVGHFLFQYDSSHSGSNFL